MRRSVRIALAVAALAVVCAATVVPIHKRVVRVKDGVRRTVRTDRYWRLLSFHEWGMEIRERGNGDPKRASWSEKSYRFGFLGLTRTRVMVAEPLDEERFGPKREYTLTHLVGTTGPDDDVKLPDGGLIAFDYDEDRSDRVALGAFIGLRWQVLDANSERIVLVGRLGKTTHMSNEPGPGRPTPEPMRDFRLEHWYLKPPFDRFRDDPAAALDGPRPAERRTHLERSDFVAKEAYGFSPDDAHFDPRRYEGPLPAR